MSTKKINKIGVFLDGTFFLKINSYYRYHHNRKSTLNFKGLMNLIRSEVSKLEETDFIYTQISEAHWFRGRYSTNQLEKKFADNAQRFTQITNERRIDDIFMYENIQQHNYPLYIDSKTGDVEEKGVDTWLSLEAFDITLRNDFDTVVLIAGDANFVPLIKKIISRGKKVMVLAWDLSYDTPSGTSAKSYKATTRTSQVLIDECTYPLMMNELIEANEENKDPIVDKIFNF